MRLNILKPKKDIQTDKAFLDYIQIPGTDVELRLVNYYNEAKQNLP